MRLRLKLLLYLRAIKCIGVDTTGMFKLRSIKCVGVDLDTVGLFKIHVCLSVSWVFVSWYTVDEIHLKG